MLCSYYIPYLENTSGGVCLYNNKKTQNFMKHKLFEGINFKNANLL